MRVAAAGAALVLTAGQVVASCLAAAAAPNAVSCHHYNQLGECVVSVRAPGGGSSGSGAGTAPAPTCTDQAGDPIRCYAPGIGWWSASLACYVQLLEPQPPTSASVWQGHTSGAIYLCTPWPLLNGTDNGWLWLASPPAELDSGRTAAMSAVKSLVLPRPSGHRSPNETGLFHGSPFTYVNLWTYFWTDASTWRTWHATATAGGVSATVTVTPTALVFTAGDGSSAVSCAGPGRAWTTVDGDDPPTDGACGFVYRAATDTPVVSTQSIRWAVSWTASDGSSGTLPDVTTSRSGRLQVLQIESVATS